MRRDVLTVAVFLIFFLVLSGHIQAKISKLEGSVYFAGHEPANLDLNQTENNVQILLYLEKKRYTLTEDLYVDAIPGVVKRSIFLMSGGEIPAGTKVDVYLIHLDSVGEKAVTLSGSITFSQPILGVNYTTVGLKASDFLGQARFTDHSLRGLESWQDEASISADAKTISLRLKVTNVLDEIRIFVLSVEEENQPPEAPTNPSPADGAAGVSFERVDFSWQASDPDGDPLFYNFYFGEGENCQVALEAEGLTGANYTKEGLWPETSYCWQVEACDEETCIAGPVWRFTTMAEAFGGHRLEVSVEPAEGGSITADGLSCPEDCEETYPEGREVTLSATPTEGFVFAGWEGDCAPCGSSASCTLLMDGDKSCLARFEEETETEVQVEVKVNGSHDPGVVKRFLSITISLNPAGEFGPGDYFLWAKLPDRKCFCYLFPDRWVACDCDQPKASFTGPFFNLQDFSVIRHLSVRHLPEGPYEVHFAVDLEPNYHFDETLVVEDQVSFVLEHEVSPCKDLEFWTCIQTPGCGWGGFFKKCVDCSELSASECLRVWGCHLEDNRCQ